MDLIIHREESKYGYECCITKSRCEKDSGEKAAGKRQRKNESKKRKGASKRYALKTTFALFANNMLFLLASLAILKRGLLDVISDYSVFIVTC